MKSMFFIMCLRSLVVRTLERYSKDRVCLLVEIHVFHFMRKLLPVEGRPCKQEHVEFHIIFIINQGLTSWSDFYLSTGRLRLQSDFFHGPSLLV